MSTKAARKSFRILMFLPLFLIFGVLAVSDAQAFDSGVLDVNSLVSSAVHLKGPAGAITTVDYDRSTTRGRDADSNAYTRGRGVDRTWDHDADEVRSGRDEDRQCWSWAWMRRILPCQ
jgi:hypothetical protein